MEPNNNQLLELILRNRALAFALAIIVVVIPLIILIISSSTREEPFQLISVSPQAEVSTNQFATTFTFEFNREMPLVQSDVFSVVVDQNVKYIYGILENKLTINLSNLLLNDEQTYTITISNLTSRSDELINELTKEFTVNLLPATSDFLSDLPYSGNGFSIIKISDSSLLVNITKKPEGKVEAAALALLEENGIDSTKFNIDVNLPSEQEFEDDSNLIRHFE
ncbi:MAG TPA: hypothetical protein VGA08_02490 [Candidatus Saccharimonadales bacterium]